MRTSYTTYRTFSRFVALRDSKHSSGRDPSLDQDFRSGVSFGNGNISLILSLLPSSAVKVMELFGFSGNRKDALNMLMSVGGWVSGQEEPTVKEGPGTEGLRRSVSAPISIPFVFQRSYAACDRSAISLFSHITSSSPVPSQ